MMFLRKIYWYVSAYVHKHGLLIFGAVVVGAILFSVFYRVVLSVSQFKKTTHVGRVGAVTLATIPRDIQEKISSGLTKVDDAGNPSPDLAERWSVEDDGRTYRFILRRGIKWHDGKELQPEDIAYNFTDTQVVVTKNEVIFKLKEAFSPFPMVVSQPIFREVRKRKWLLLSDAIILGTGQFKVVQMKNEGGQVREIEIESQYERFVYRFYPTEERALLAYKRGEVDLLEDMSSIDALQEWSRTTITPLVRKDRYIAIFFNTGNELYEKTVRQALNYALQKPVGDERVETPIDPRSWAYNKTVKEYPYDQAKAVSLLLRSVPKQRLNIELTTAVQFQHDAENIKTKWEELGKVAAVACRQSKDTDKNDCPNLEISVQLKVSNAPDINTFQVLLVAQQIPPDPDQYFLWHSTQQTNFMRYLNPHVDKLLEDGRKSLDRKERRDAYLDFQQILAEDSPAIFLRHPTVYTIKRR